MAKVDPQRHHRRSIRLKEYDYASPGGYFVTIVAWQRECLFGEMVNKEMKVNYTGKSSRNGGMRFRNIFKM